MKRVLGVLLLAVACSKPESGATGGPPAQVGGPPGQTGGPTLTLVTTDTAGVWTDGHGRYYREISKAATNPKDPLGLFPEGTNGNPPAKTNGNPPK